MVKRAAKKAHMITVSDRGEPVSEMEPLLIGETSRHRAKLTDMAVEFAQKAAVCRRSLIASLANNTICSSKPKRTSRSKNGSTAADSKGVRRPRKGSARRETAQRLLADFRREL
jgi:hypothetical protein